MIIQHSIVMTVTMTMMTLTAPIFSSFLIMMQQTTTTTVLATRTSTSRLSYRKKLFATKATTTTTTKPLTAFLGVRSSSSHNDISSSSSVVTRRHLSNSRTNNNIRSTYYLTPKEAYKIYNHHQLQQLYYSHSMFNRNWISSSAAAAASTTTCRHVSLKSKNHSSNEQDDNDKNNNDDTSSSSSFFANIDFQSLGIQSSILLERIQTNLQLIKPTSIQAAAYDAIANNNHNNVVIGAETGTGKTLAYLLPIMDDIIQRKNNNDNDNHIPNYEYARALILVPNKELIQQVVRMAIQLAGGNHAIIFPPNAYGGSGINIDLDDDNNDDKNIVRIAIMPGGLKEVSIDYLPFRNSLSGKAKPPDIIISTPAAVGPLGISPKNINMFADIQTVVIDEADMLLDGGYIKPLQDVFMGFRRADKMIQKFTKLSSSEQQEWGEDYNNDENENMNNMIMNNKNDKKTKKSTQYIFVAATLPDYGLRSVDAYIQKKFPNIQRISTDGMHNARHYGLALPTIWISETSKQERMKSLVQLFSTNNKSSSTDDNVGLQNEKVMIFLNSVEDVENACQALNRAGIVQALPYHAKVSLEDRTITLDKFRQYNPTTATNIDEDRTTEPVVLVCTDLASRGLDIPGVTCIVQLQFASNVVAHLHRMGRCGRAGQRIGRGIIYYDPNVEGELVRVVQDAERKQQQQQQQQQGRNNKDHRMILPGDVVADAFEEPTDGIVENTTDEDTGKVQKAFSRKRGFTKKLKKLRRESNVGND